MKIHVKQERFRSLSQEGRSTKTGSFSLRTTAPADLPCFAMNSSNDPDKELEESIKAMSLLQFPILEGIEPLIEAETRFKMENGHSSMYTWILGTGWWKSRAPINPDAVIVVGFLCSCLIGGFIFINRVKAGKSISTQTSQSIKLVLVIISLYCLWCTSQIYWRNPPQPAVGEEADLGVLVFLSIYFFLPHSLCIMSMNPKEYLNTTGPLPL